MLVSAVFSGLVLIFTNASVNNKPAIRFKEEIPLEGLSNLCGCPIEIKKQALNEETMAPPSLKGIYKGLYMACRIDKQKVCGQISAIELVAPNPAAPLVNPSLQNGVLSFDLKQKMNKRKVLNALGISTSSITNIDTL